MKIVLAGGTGQIGHILARHCQAGGHKIVVLGRHSHTLWDGKSDGPWMREIDGADVVINLAGRSVNCRYTPVNMKLIRDSRVDATLAVGRAIQAAGRPPPLWLQMSTATIYDHRYDSANDEASGQILQEHKTPAYWREIIQLVLDWEKALNDSPTPRTRKVALRSSIVLSPDRGGVFDVFLKMTRLGLGGSIAGGRQFVSWIHARDFVRIVDFLIANETISGAVNVCAPNPVPQKEFMATLRRAAHVPIGLPTLKWMAEVGAFVLRTDTELVLKSRRVVPKRLLDLGFRFEFPDWESAAQDLIRK